MRANRVKMMNKSHIMHQTLISKTWKKVKLDSPEQIYAMGHFLGATILLGHLLNTINTETYILKAGVAGVQTPQTILNFLQRDCLRTQKLSVSVPES